MHRHRATHVAAERDIVAGRLRSPAHLAPSTHARGPHAGVPQALRAVIGPIRAEDTTERSTPCRSSPGGSSSRRACTSATRRDGGTRRCSGTSSGSVPGSTSSTSSNPCPGSRKRTPSFKGSAVAGGSSCSSGRRSRPRRSSPDTPAGSTCPSSTTAGWAACSPTSARSAADCSACGSSARWRRPGPWNASPRRRRSACGTSGRSSSGTSEGSRTSSGCRTRSS